MSILDNEDILLNNINEIPIRNWLNKNIFIENGKIKINKTMPVATVDIIKSNDHDLSVLLNKQVSHIPVKLFTFGKIEGDFICSHSALTSLKGMPRIIEGFCNCFSCNKLINTDGCPDWIRDEFILSSCHNLKEITDIPKYIGVGGFNCSGCDKLYNFFTDFNKINIKGFNCAYCKNIINLPNFLNKFPGYIDLSCCKQLDIKEYLKLPSYIETYLFISCVPFLINSVIDKHTLLIKYKNTTKKIEVNKEICW